MGRTRLNDDIDGESVTADDARCKICRASTKLASATAEGKSGISTGRPPTTPTGTTADSRTSTKLTDPTGKHKPSSTRIAFGMAHGSSIRSTNARRDAKPEDGGTTRATR